MEYHGIGERFEYNGVLLEVSVSTDGCAECFFSKEDNCISSFPINCSMHERNDSKSIVYKLVEQCKTKNMEQKTEIKVAERTNTAAWFNYRSLYGLGLLDKLPNMVNTTNRVNSFVVKAFTFMQQYAKRSNELARKERALSAAVAKFGITKEQAEQMYLAGLLKL